MAINDPVVLRYIADDETPKSLRGEYVFQQGREWLYNRDPDRPFAVDEVVHFRDPENALIYLERFHPDWFARYEPDPDLDAYLESGHLPPDPDPQMRLFE